MKDISFKEVFVILCVIYISVTSYIIQIPHWYSSVPRGRQALCMKDSHISLQFNMVLSSFAPHLKQYSSLFVGSQIWHLNTPSTICVSEIHNV